jgi:phage terminase protein|nr:MAG TPA: Large Terminase [Caudoviricetes sp.]
MTQLITAMDPRAKHYGARVQVCATALGEPLFGWQQTAAALISAVDPDRPTTWRYPLVVITVPRQSGKSTLLRAVHMDRLIKPLPNGRPRLPSTIWMTAQKGKDARRRFNDLAERATASPALGQLTTLRRSVGSEALQLGNVALSPFAPTPTALHGETTPFVSIDEAWAFDEASSAALLAAITPTQQNVEGSQLIIISTAGDRTSKWLWSLVKAGRASLADPHSRMAYIEFSADPRYAEDGDGDPLSPEALDFHPAVSHITTAADITALYPSAGGLDNIRRGFLNLWPADMDTAVARDLNAYDDATVTNPPPRTGELVFAFDVARDRTGASIYAAYPTPTGSHVELVESRPGVAWLPGALAALHGPCWYDPTGYPGAIAARLTTHLLRPATGTRMADATATLLSEIADLRASVLAPTELRDQYRDAVTRPAGGAGFAFDPDKSPGPIDHLRAAALALHAVTRPTAMPGISF